MKQKTTSTLNIVITLCIIVFINGCKKNELQTLQNIKPSESQTISKINAWLDKKKAVTINQRSTDRTLQDIIQSVKDNLDFDNLRYEELRDGEKFVIVPINKSFKSLNNQDKNPINILLFVLDKNENIRKGEIVQYMPVNSQLTSVPVNTFYNFFNFKKIADDATLTFLNIKDAFLREYKIKDGKMLNYRRVQKKNKEKERVICTNYYMVYTWEDGREDWHYLYSVCEDVPCELARMINGLVFRTDCGGSGGGGEVGNEESQGTPDSREVKLAVKREQTTAESWEMFCVFTLSGIRYTNPDYNYFTSITADESFTFWSFDAARTNWEFSLSYSIYSGPTITKGLLNNYKTASGRMSASLYYPNKPHDDPERTRAFSEVNAWGADRIFY